MHDKTGLAGFLVMCMMPSQLGAPLCDVLLLAHARGLRNCNACMFVLPLAVH